MGRSGEIIRGGRFRRITGVLMAVVLCAGTATAQKKYERPPAGAPDEFRGAGPAEQTSIGDLKWLRSSKTPSLELSAGSGAVRLRKVSPRHAARAKRGPRARSFPQFEPPT